MAKLKKIVQCNTIEDYNALEKEVDTLYLVPEQATDTTLTESGVPADAKAVGDALANVGGYYRHEITFGGGNAPPNSKMVIYNSRNTPYTTFEEIAKENRIIQYYNNSFGFAGFWYGVYFNGNDQDGIYREWWLCTSASNYTPAINTGDKIGNDDVTKQ